MKNKQPTITAAQFFALYGHLGQAEPKPLTSNVEKPVRISEQWNGTGWDVVRQWADGRVTRVEVL